MNSEPRSQLWRGGGGLEPMTLSTRNIVQWQDLGKEWRGLALQPECVIFNWRLAMVLEAGKHGKRLRVVSTRREHRLTGVLTRRMELDPGWNRDWIRLPYFCVRALCGHVATCVINMYCVSSDTVGRNAWHHAWHVWTLPGPSALPGTASSASVGERGNCSLPN